VYVFDLLFSRIIRKENCFGMTLHISRQLQTLFLSPAQSNQHTALRRHHENITLHHTAKP
jgi:hypothetical protein